MTVRAIPETSMRRTALILTLAAAVAASAHAQPQFGANQPTGAGAGQT